MPETRFDPNSAAIHEGIFGLPHGPDEARVRLLAVPFEATCSSARGTAGGPRAIVAQSWQVDLLSSWSGAAWEAGIHLDPELPEFAELNERASSRARAVIAAAGRETAELAAAQAEVDRLSARRSEIVEAWTHARLGEGRMPGILGGDHSCPLGALRAAAAAGPLSILHFDAHHDLRECYEGFLESHASIMFNVLEQCPNVAPIVQIGIRDVCEQERDLAASSTRVRAHPWSAWCTRRFEGEPFAVLAREAIADLTDRVWVSFDIDGLDPTFCPGTGTPVPGGLSFDEAAFVLAELRRSARTVVGFDLSEVGPGVYDGNVGARVLYELCALYGAGRGTGGAR